MKQRLLLVLTGTIMTCTAFAQQKRTIEYMAVTILKDNGSDERVRWITTREDGSQKEDTLISKDLGSSRNSEKAYERIQLQILKKYFDDGWKLTSSMSEVFPFVNWGQSFSPYVRNRYFLSREPAP